MWNYNYNLQQDNELAHHGILGMKWGVRRVRDHSGPGKYLTRNRQVAGDKKDLDRLNKGAHLSKGITKKRQAAYDARDKKALEKRIDNPYANVRYKSDKYSERVMNAKSNVKGMRNLKKYEKTAGKDALKAEKYGDTKKANELKAGRTYAKMILDTTYLTRSISDASVKANVEAGKNFTYKVTRNNESGTVDITVNNKTSSYSYGPEKDKN